MTTGRTGGAAQEPLVSAVGFLCMAALVWWLARNTLDNLDRQGIALGFGFLGRPAGFALDDTLLAFEPAHSYARAILAGLLNTVAVAVLGCVLAGVLGFLLGALRLSDNPIVEALVRAYVELMRNTPLLLQLLFWSAVIHALPPVRAAAEPLPGVFLSNRGLVLPYPVPGAAPLWAGGLLLVLLLAGRRVLPARLVTPARLLAAAGFAAALALAPPEWRVPRLKGFNFVGGATVSPEFTALLAGLVLHHAAGVSEIVRGAVLGVPAGQWEAAQALGLTRARTLHLVVLPQALRAMVPLLASTALNLTKGSSLAVAIGFPDVVSVLGTIGSQTGQEIEVMALLAGLFLALNLATSSALNAYNARLLRRGER
ncbi:ABC transporter permease subunit [Azospirillum sp. TSO22-1]|uniref:amino acid ABC transporter permease n=1 Tax=Azospirillum sp. TSO22-1 TaxID=716789 RepID=UPI000D616869|nr:ABC transporter permease subunit [Azospirillum sp. TSO22-1]PWC40388.1 hypothetical protein TSO221_25405 [Azospirillum sp. TSO22-1]